MTDTTGITGSFFPAQDHKSLGVDVFNRIKVPVDYCTARQAEQIVDNGGLRPQGFLEDVAAGKISSEFFTPEEAQQELNRIRNLRNKER